MGFTFDDSSEDATPVAEYAKLSIDCPAITEVIRPYLGGEEVLTDPKQEPHRYAICLADMSEQEARNAWPALIDILERKVRPARSRLGNSAIDMAHKERWWLFGNDRPALRTALRGLSRMIAIPRVATHLCAVLLPATHIPADQLVILGFESLGMVAIVQSRPHELWARFFSSTMGDGLRYAPSDCFETFPFPAGWEDAALLEKVGKEYYDFRADLMVRNNEGLTETYNRFHDPDETRPDILKLRELHAAMDRAVLDAYGWTDIQPNCEFILDYEDDDEDETTSSRRKKKPWRYRWPDDIRDEVLARLLELNAQRAKEHSLVSKSVAGVSPARKKKRGPKKKAETAQPIALFGEEQDE